MRTMSILKLSHCNGHLFRISCLIARCFSVKSETIVKDELNKFNEHAKRWWDEEGPVKALHAFNNLRVPFVRDAILNNPSQPSSGPKSQDKNGPHPLKGYRLIDVGCGAGILSEALARIGADVTGLDAGEELIAVAKDHAKLDSSLADNLGYVNSTVEQHSVENSAYYDGVVCSEVIEHVNNPAFFVENCVKLVKPGGSLVFTTINRTWLAGFIAIFLAENVVGTLPKGTHQYHMLMPDKDLEKMLKSSNCDIRKTAGFMHLPNGSWTTFPTKSVFYALHAVKLT